MGNLEGVFSQVNTLEGHTETHKSSFFPSKQVSGRNGDHEWLRMTNAFILCDLIWKIQKSHTANREGSFKSVIYIIEILGWPIHHHLNQNLLFEVDHFSTRSVFPVGLPESKIIYLLSGVTKVAPTSCSDDCSRFSSITSNNKTNNWLFKRIKHPAKVVREIYACLFTLGMARFYQMIYQLDYYQLSLTITR